MCVKVTGHTVESVKFYSKQERGRQKMATTHKHIPEMRVQLKMPHPHCCYSPVFLSVVTADHLAFEFHVSTLSPVCFSQLRAQNQVLKKAVVDEQASTVSLKVN